MRNIISKRVPTSLSYTRQTDRSVAESGGRVHLQVLRWKTVMILQDVSSDGRALVLQAGGRRFEPYTTY